MLGKKQSKKMPSRARQPSRGLNESFRRNNVVISRHQQELAQRQQSVTQRQVEKQASVRRRRRNLRLILGGSIVLLLLLGYRLQIRSVAVESNASTRLTTVAKQEYEAKILSIYNQHTLAGQSWLLDRAALQEAILNSYPEVERVDFSSAAPLTSTLRVTIRFRKALFRWVDASGTTQFVDAHGILFTKNLDPTVNPAKLVRIEDQSGAVLQAGSSVLTGGLIQFIGQLPAKLMPLYGKDAVISRVIIPVSTREVHIQLTNIPYLLKFSAVRDLDEQIGELTALLGFLKTNQAVPGSYIDLRVAHKAFYR